MSRAWSPEPVAAMGRSPHRGWSAQRPSVVAAAAVSRSYTAHVLVTPGELPATGLGVLSEVEDLRDRVVCFRAQAANRRPSRASGADEPRQDGLGAGTSATLSRVSSVPLLERAGSRRNREP